MTQNPAARTRCGKFEKNVRVTVTPKLYKWPDGGKTTYIPGAVEGDDEFVELVRRGKISRIVQKAGADVGWTLHVAGVILPTRKNSRYKQTRIVVNRLTILPGKRIGSNRNADDPHKPTNKPPANNPATGLLENGFEPSLYKREK